jgi:hypothetical protein
MSFEVGFRRNLFWPTLVGGLLMLLGACVIAWRMASSPAWMVPCALLVPGGLLLVFESVRRMRPDAVSLRIDARGVTDATFLRPVLVPWDNIVGFRQWGTFTLFGMLLDDRAYVRSIPWPLRLVLPFRLAAQSPWRFEVMDTANMDAATLLRILRLHHAQHAGAAPVASP